MSQLPTIKIADLLTGTRVGMLYGRITDIFVSEVKSKFANPPDSIVNVYKVKLIDETGEITYSDWCKKPGITRTYQIGKILKFAHAKLKPSANIDPNTGVLYPPNITAEKSTVVELMNDDGTIIPRTASAPAPQAVASIPTIPVPVASSPIPNVTVFPNIPVALSTPETEWLNVKAQYPTFYNAVDVFFGELFKLFPEAQQNALSVQYSGLMDLIWGKE